MSRDHLASALTAAGIGHGIIYPRLVFDYPCFRDDPQVIPGDLPTAHRVIGQLLSLPVHPGLDESQLDQIAAAIRRLWGEDP